MITRPNMGSMEHQTGHQTEPRAKRLKKAGIAATAGVATVAAGALGSRYGFTPDFIDSQIIPRPPVYPQVVDGMVAVNEGIRSAAPIAAAGSLVWMARNSWRGRMDAKQGALNRLSKVEYSGVDEMQRRPDESISGKTKEHFSKFRKGAGMAALAILLTSATSGLEQEVSNGPLRPIEAITNLLPSDEAAHSVVLQSGDVTFMDSSYTPSDSIEELMYEGVENDVTVVPFSKTLMKIDGDSALQLSVPDEIFTRLSGVEVDADCSTVPAIVDETVKAEVGESININDVKSQVVKVEEGMAHMNRHIAIMSETDMRECLKRGTDNSYFGAFVAGGEPKDVESMFRSMGLPGVTTISLDKFEDNNRDFWRANGTPVLLQLIAYLAIFGATTAIGERKNSLERNVKEIGIMKAAGVSTEDIKSIEDRRAFSETMRATILATPATPLVAAAFNASISGLQVGVGPHEIAVGSMITLGAKVFAGRRAVNSFEKNLDLSQAVKG